MDWEYFKKQDKWSLLFLVGLFVCFLTSIAFLASFHAIFEMACSFRAHYFYFLLLLSLPFFKTKRLKTGITFCLFAFLNFSQYINLYSNPNNLYPSVVETLFVYNLHSANKDYQKTIDFIKKSHFDHISLIEVTPEWEQAIIRGLSEEFPHIVSQAQRNNFGIMFLSKHKFTGTVHTHEDIPYLQADFGDDFSLFTIHPMPPLNQHMFQLRQGLLDQLAENVTVANPNRLVCGDFNTVPWSPNFKSFEKKTNLTNAAKSFGVQPTWPSSPWFLRIPIDHCLVSQNIIIDNFEVGPDLGSDHLPLIIRISAQVLSD